ncbi:SitI3 family protein [Kribbella sp. NPDC051587]|uniref:SitI3 family protein n=1 Tax=Kribbella sp. NPDC051587 TaxID=3364119 RepID=UPI0037B0CE1B
MAIEYTLQLCTAAAPEVIGRLLELPEVEWQPPVLAFKSATGLRVTVHRDGRPNFVLVEPEIAVGFRLDKFTDFEPQYAELARHVVTLLTAEAGDAVLQQSFERILLLRRGDDLAVSGGFWHPELLPWPYVVRAMPYPED